jgi:nucleoside-diphosphate-sugar epimerase
MNILLTGAAGYTGRGIGSVLMTAHHVRGLDINEAGDAVHESLVGDITDLDICHAASEGMDALVLCHMAPNPVGYETPTMAVDINVKGTANLYHAAMERGITRVVLISTVGVLNYEQGADAVPGDGPYRFGHQHSHLYVLTKIMQEVTARSYFDRYGIVTSILRPSWIVYDESFVTKYGQRLEQYDPSYIDPRDIGTAILYALALPDPTLEAFNLGQDDFTMADMATAHQRLRWTPQYRFTGLPRP